MKELKLREFMDGDIVTFKEWLYLPHILKWYHEPLEWIGEVDHRKDSFQWVHHYIAEYNTIPIGFCQYYEYSKSGEVWHGNTEMTGTYSIDYLIGKVDYLKRGLGKAMIKELIGKVKCEENAKRIIVQPEAENAASCNLLLSSTFQFDEKNRIYIMNL